MHDAYVYDCIMVFVKPFFKFPFKMNRGKAKMFLEIFCMKFSKKLIPIEMDRLNWKSILL